TSAYRRMFKNLDWAMFSTTNEHVGRPQVPPKPGAALCSRTPDRWGKLREVTGPKTREGATGAAGADHPARPDAVPDLARVRPPHCTQVPLLATALHSLCHRRGGA